MKNTPFFAVMFVVLGVWVFMNTWPPYTGPIQETTKIWLDVSQNSDGTFFACDRGDTLHVSPEDIRMG